VSRRRSTFELLLSLSLSLSLTLASTLGLTLGFPRALMAASPRGPAAADAPGHPTLTEAEYLDALGPEHPAVVARGADLGAARAARQRAATRPDPWLQADLESPGDTDQTTVQLRWAPPWDGRRGLAVAAAEAGVEAEERRLESGLLEVRLTLRSAFAAWAGAARRQEILERQAARTAELARVMQLRAERGEVSGLAARRLEMAAAQARAEAAVAGAELDRAAAAALAWRPDLPPGLDPRLPRLPPAPETVDLTARGDLAAYRAELEQARLDQKLSRRFLRFPELGVGWQRLEEGPAAVSGPVLGLGWRLPLFDRGQAQRLAAETRAAAVEAALAVATERARAELAGARAAYDRLRRSALETAADAAKAAAVLEAAEAAYRLGESDLTDLLDTLRSLRATELAALDLHTAALEAHRQLEAAAGRPLRAGATPTPGGRP
jgi:outer membrane protein TolC